MKISELIQKLETIQNQDGDIKIQTVDPNDFYQSVPVSNVTVMTENDGKSFVLIK